MKCFSLFFVIIFFFSSIYAQQTIKADNALLLEYYQTQRFADAAAYLKKTYPEPVTDANELTQLAYASQMAGELANAEDYYQRIYNTDSTNTNVLFNLGAINLRRGNDLKAEVYYKKLAQRDTTNFMLYKQLANISLDKGDPAMELNYLQKANMLNPAEPDVASDLSDMYVNLKKDSLAENILNLAITADPENAVLLLSQLKLVYSQNKWPETEAVCIKLTQQGNRSGYVLTRLGIAYYNLKNYECAIETLADLSEAEQTETSFYITALAWKELENQNNAITYLAKAITAGISPNIGGYYSETGDSYEILKMYKKAAAAYKKGLQFEEKPITYYILATLYDSGLRNQRTAIIYYRKYIEAHPPAKEEKYKTYAKKRMAFLRR